MTKVVFLAKSLVWNAAAKIETNQKNIWWNNKIFTRKGRLFVTSSWTKSFIDIHFRPMTRFFVIIVPGWFFHIIEKWIAVKWKEKCNSHLLLFIDKIKTISKMRRKIPNLLLNIFASLSWWERYSKSSTASIFHWRLSF